MPNIKIKTPLKEQDLNDFMKEVSEQVRQQTGRGYTWWIAREEGFINLHYEPESADLLGAVYEKGQAQVRKLYGNKVQVGTSGAYAIGRGKLKKAIKVFMKQRGYPRVDFREWM